MVTRNRTWDDTSCIPQTSYNSSWTSRRICRKTVGYFRAGNGVFYKVIYKQTNDYQVALRTCVEERATLAIAYGKENVDVLAAVRGIIIGIPAEGFWVDGREQGVEGRWVLSNGTLNFQNDHLSAWHRCTKPKVLKMDLG